MTEVWARDLAGLDLKNSMVCNKPSDKLLTGFKPVADNFSTAAMEWFTSPARAGAYLISDLEAVSRQRVVARSLMVVRWP